MNPPSNGSTGHQRIIGGLAGWVFGRLGIEPWGQLLILVLVAASAVVWKDYSHIEGQIASGKTTSTKQMSQISTRLSLIEQKLGIPVGPDLLNDARNYVIQKDFSKAAKLLDESTASIKSAMNKNSPESPRYFSEMIATLNEIQSKNPPVGVSTRLFAARIALASYRSSLESPPDIPSELRRIPPGVRIITPQMLGGRAVYRITRGLSVPRGSRLLSHGAAINGTDIPDWQEMLSPPSRSISQNGDITVQGLVLIGGSQSLDGIIWENVTFFRERISYNGGDLALEGARFIDCVFDMEDSKTGRSLADYAALLKNSLSHTS